MLDRLRELLDYNPATGVFRWKVSTARRVKVGDIAGYRDKSGRMSIRIEGKRWLGARLAWYMATGQMPEGDVDHKDTDPSNDRLANLRDISHKGNSHNVRAAFRHGSSGQLGAHRNGKRWAAKITVDGKSVWLGRYSTPEAAHAAYLKAKRELHEGCTL